MSAWPSRNSDRGDGFCYFDRDRAHYAFATGCERDGIWDFDGYEEIQRERPLTHDLRANILRALGAKIDRVIVNDLKRGTYFARLVLTVENELNQKKIVEIDARPSDCIAMAIQQLAPIYVSLGLWDAVEDMTEALRKIQEKGPHAEERDDEAES